jgi:hypothetical protein
MLYGFRIFKEDSFRSKVFGFYHYNSLIIIIQHRIIWKENKK